MYVCLQSKGLLTLSSAASVRSNFTGIIRRLQPLCVLPGLQGKHQQSDVPVYCANALHPHSPTQRGHHSAGFSSQDRAQVVGHDMHNRIFECFILRAAWPCFNLLAIPKHDTLSVL